MTTKEQKAREYGLKESKPGDEFGYSSKYLAYLAGYSAAEEKYREVVRAAKSALYLLEELRDRGTVAATQEAQLRNALKNLTNE